MNDPIAVNKLLSNDSKEWNLLILNGLGELLISGRRFEGRDFVGFDFTGVRFEACQFFDCKFNRVQLSQTAFLNCSFINISFSNVTGDFVKFHHCLLDTCQISNCGIPGANFSNSIASNLTISSLNAFRLCWENGRISSSDFDNSDLIYSQFRETRFRGVAFFNCNLCGAEFSAGFIAIRSFKSCMVDGVVGVESPPRSPNGQPRLSAGPA